MKTKSVLSTLNKILTAQKLSENKTVFKNGNRSIEVVDQSGNAVCLPIIDGQVVHNGNYTIKNLVSFITQDLSEEQLSYLKTLKSMYSKVSNESRIESAKHYKEMI